MSSLPPLIELEENSLDIEIRGELDKNGIFFKLEDVSRVFGLRIRTKDIIPHTHYDEFMNKDDKLYFLTYQGMVKVFEKTKAMDVFKYWLDECIMGTYHTTSTVFLPDVRSVLKRHAYPVSCVYILLLGDVNKLRVPLSINNGVENQSVVIKYGCTENLSRRLTELRRMFSWCEDMELWQFCCVEPSYLMVAETNLRRFLTPHLYASPISDELAILPPKQTRDVKRQMEIIYHCYAGRQRDLMMRVQELEHQIELERAQHRIGKLEQQLELQKLQHQVERSQDHGGQQ